MPLTFVTTAIKRINKGGLGTKYRWKDGKPATGTDYIIFKCPSCLKRNKQSLYESPYTTPQQTVAFTCNNSTCRSTVEVNLPIADRVGKLIISPDEYRERKKLIHASS